jgi:phosphoglycerate dehydrogenase-like enzyme
MHRLLIAERAYERIRTSIPGEVQVIQLDNDGRFLVDGKPLGPEDVRPTMLRLDWDLMMSGHIKSVVEIVQASEEIEFVQTSAAGLDNPLFGLVRSKARAFCNSDAQAPPIAEFVVASVLNHWHQFELRAERQRGRQWRGNRFKEMLDSNWLIVGFGNIGQRIAKQVKAFGGSVTAIRRNLSEVGPADSVDVLANLYVHLPTADVVVLACALNDETRLLAGAEFFRAMKADALLVNIARGGLVDEVALLEALDAKAFDAAVLDVFETEPLPDEHPFWGHPRVYVTPHSSNQGLGTERRGDALFLDNLQRFLDGRSLRNLVPVES